MRHTNFGTCNVTLRSHCIVIYIVNIYEDLPVKIIRDTLTVAHNYSRLKQDAIAV